LVLIKEGVLALPVRKAQRVLLEQLALLVHLDLQVPQVLLELLVLLVLHLQLLVQLVLVV
jgi:hypothetical protein